MNLVRTVASSVATACMVVSLTLPGQAAQAAISGDTVVLASSTWQVVPASELVPQSNSLSPLDGYVEFSSVGYRITAPNAVLQTIPAGDLSQLQTAISDVNSNIAQGLLEMADDGTAVQIPVRFGVSPLTTWRGSHGYIRTHWYGLEVHLDAYAANKVIGGAWAGSGAAALRAALGGGPYAAAVAAALGAAAGVLQLCQASNGSVTVYFLAAILPGSAVCNPFA